MIVHKSKNDQSLCNYIIKKSHILADISYILITIFDYFLWMWYNYIIEN